MFKKLTISALTAGAIAMAPVATPQAQARDAGDVIAGLAILGLLGGTALAIHNRQHGYTPQAQPRRTHVHQPRVTHQPVVTQGYHRNVGHVHTKPRRHYNAKPNECLRQRWTHHGWQTFYSQRCLARYGF